jgi:hypothetical protein
VVELSRTEGENIKKFDVVIANPPEPGWL